MRLPRSLVVVVIAAVAALVLAAPVAASGGGAAHDPVHVYTESNAASGNEVLVFVQRRDGTLRHVASHPTGGLGTGAGLGSQGAVTLSDNGRWLLAVDAGSDEISTFALKPDGDLQQTDRAPAGGDQPISVTIHGSLVYVVHAGSGTISGFRLGHDGALSPISGSTKPLSSPAAGPAQIEFSPNGNRLVVAEKDTNVISTYRIDVQGRAIGPIVTASAGMTPFGFAFDDSSRLIVSEAFGGTPDASAVSAYRIKPDGTLNTLTASLGTTQTAACWVAIGGRFAYVTNTGSGTLSSYRLTASRGITLDEPIAGETGDGSAPTDLAVAGQGRFVFVLASGTDEIVVLRILGDGRLAWASSAGGLPATTVGLAAR